MNGLIHCVQGLRADARVEQGPLHKIVHAPMLIQGQPCTGDGIERRRTDVLNRLPGAGYALEGRFTGFAVGARHAVAAPPYRHRFLAPVRPYYFTLELARKFPIQARPAIQPVDLQFIGKFRRRHRHGRLGLFADTAQKIGYRSDFLALEKLPEKFIIYPSERARQLQLER